MKCPKCTYERQPTDEAPDWQCPSCKVAYVKALQAQGLAPKPVEASASPADIAAPPIRADAAQGDHDLQLGLAAQGQKILIYSILLNFILRAIERSTALPDLVVHGLLVCLAVYSLTGVVKICSGLGKAQHQKILFMVLSFFPLIGLVSLVYLSVKTSRVLRQAGMDVGLFGAKP